MIPCGVTPNPRIVFIIFSWIPRDWIWNSTFTTSTMEWKELSIYLLFIFSFGTIDNNDKLNANNNNSVIDCCIFGLPSLVNVCLFLTLFFSMYYTIQYSKRSDRTKKPSFRLQLQCLFADLYTQKHQFIFHFHFLVKVN